MDSSSVRITDFSGIKNVDTLQLLVADLSRRLENANNTIDAHKSVAKNSVTSADRCRRDLTEISITLRLEMAKSDCQKRQKLKEDEAKNFEIDKGKRRIVQEKLRMAELDYHMSPSNRASKRIDAMKAQIVSLGANQESQKRFLTHLVEIEKMTEDLSSAAQHNDLYQCSLLLRRGAGVNDVDSAGFLPLHYACASGSVDIVQLLCEFGSDPSSYISGHSAVEIAARNGQKKVIQILVSFGATVDDKGMKACPPIVSAAANNHINCIEELLLLDADIDAVDVNQDSCLHLATQLEDPVEMIMLLLNRGADAECLNNQGSTPLDLAMETNNINLIRALGGD
jgi:hypothetical protein